MEKYSPKLLAKFGKEAKIAYHLMFKISSEKKNNALRKIGQIIYDKRSQILKENEKDLSNAENKIISAAKKDRLLINQTRLDDIISTLQSIANQQDPTGKILNQWSRPSGINIKKVSTPIGVVAIIYESRPNVTIDAGALCIKSGNSAILRPGSESFFTSLALQKCIEEGLISSGLPEKLIQMIPTTDRKAVTELLQMKDYVDVIVPRGGRDLIQLVQNNTKIPVFAHLDGIVHAYIHSDARPKIAERVIINSKLRRPGICGALECLLINRKFFQQNGKLLLKSLINKNVEIRGDQLVGSLPGTSLATKDDWGKEFLDKILAVKVVENLSEAISHIKRFGSNHTDCIITDNEQIAETFFTELDSAILMHNVSTQFADGGEFGMGAEIGIGTGKLHARGPIGADQLTSFKYLVQGDGILRD